MLIIIDGYNLIRTVSGLDAGTKSRDNLISILSRYKNIKGYEMKVVFDGATYGRGEQPFAPTQVISGIEVIFSGMGSDADTVIKKLASQRRDPGNICVVTADREIIDFVKRCGNTVLDPERFYRKILNTLNIEKESYSEPRCKFEPPSQEEIDYWLTIFIGKRGDDKKDNKQ